ncbi:L-serine ammonia-lyase, iron-sulfur-dependent, subunit alpha [Carnobacterium divergens]|uniref:L-serine dehydratase n=1 Tax=Carnobacterium divergens DSM 20623 TaxID=1449336 RepID=A0A0R2HNF3_CARDV|nr:L-serine ammonia-lyase, iron-sulfur-dependent, subunit alpha [Carnobacterium divergens]AOA00061.1 L-serine dehydratase, iron-sulfur-dependent subunit alpha [Carnobacterium divergens]KRN54434.1 L-serine dehydratase, iron-sulfur-dependent, subunit alpha [Carnobacterium divergens DSM 20623]MDO0873922.1 L-serine ammonia-lyase, iron-sulfur-dependent, subunit alpha [Carnobacterium divergens]MDT1996405.1 L-serine ammonia-lyase, iron-sulfur-dependent, subunit alpha [Carnobacterium divergens]MDT2010
MFQNVSELVEQANQLGSVFEVMIALEMETTRMPRTEILKKMEQQLTVMENAVEKGVNGVSSATGLTGGDATKLKEYIERGNFLSGETILTAVRNAVATNEVNAAMGLVCATPTAGSAGVVPGVLFAAKDRLNMNREAMVRFLFTAGAFGLVIANNASISGAEGGCQAEIGSASAIASAALVDASGGTPEMCSAAIAMTLKNMMGLICDPVAGLVEVPCVKRNALGAAQAMISADMALAGITSVIPTDEVIEAMYKVGRQMPSIFKETAEGGLADTPTGREIKMRIFGNPA